VSQPTLFDSHAHLTAETFDPDREVVLARAHEAGVVEMVSIASDPRDAREAISLARRRPGVWATAGLHPHAAGSTSDAVLGDIERLAASEEVVAIGETGLDYHYDHSPRELQRTNFRAHLELAASVALPIVVHARDAEEETTALVEEFAGRVRGVLHCFAGGDRLLDAGLEAGWYVSFSGLITFVDSLAPAARRVPSDRILIETDAPYLAPVPRRGRRNEPGFLVHTCERLAELRGVEMEEMAACTRCNAHRFYGLDPEVE